jgi:hypothetical protein
LTAHEHQYKKIREELSLMHAATETQLNHGQCLTQQQHQSNYKKRPHLGFGISYTGGCILIGGQDSMWLLLARAVDAGGWRGHSYSDMACEC